MGRLFLVEFDDFDSGKLFVCASCGTPLARNTDVFLYWKRPGELLADIGVYLLLKKISNVRDCDAVLKADGTQVYNRQQLLCVVCNKEVGFTFTNTEPPKQLAFQELLSSRVRFRMSGDEHDPSSIPADHWFDPPLPVS